MAANDGGIPMGRPYVSEMSRLESTFAWAQAVDIGNLTRAVAAATVFPLRAVGSGGSLTVAHAMQSFHRRYSGKLATVSTPLEASSDTLSPDVSNWLFSAGGRNSDILNSARNLIDQEPRHLAVLCGDGRSPLARLAKSHPFVDLLVYANPAGKDGFLATNSLLAFTTLLARAYTNSCGSIADWNMLVDVVGGLLSRDSPAVSAWRQETAHLWTRPATIVLHGPASRVGAIDIESKFTEAALGFVQLADYRNFAHGRHHWLAKRGNESAVLAFATDEDRSLANKTLNLLPSDIPRVRVDIPSSGTSATIASVVAALLITGWAAAGRKIDPGKPGVPTFGRRIYHLSVRRPSRGRRVCSLTRREEAAITRKAGNTTKRLHELNTLDRWRHALARFRNQLLATRFGAIVLDFDGTIVDARTREFPMTRDISDQLLRIVQSGIFPCSRHRARKVSSLRPAEMFPSESMVLYLSRLLQWR